MMKRVEPKTNQNLDELEFVACEVVEAGEQELAVKAAEPVHEEQCAVCKGWLGAGWAHARCYRIAPEALPTPADYAEVVE